MVVFCASSFVCARACAIFRCLCVSVCSLAIRKSGSTKFNFNTAMNKTYSSNSEIPRTLTLLELRRRWMLTIFLVIFLLKVTFKLIQILWRIFRSTVSSSRLENSGLTNAWNSTMWEVSEFEDCCCLIKKSPRTDNGEMRKRAISLFSSFLAVYEKYYSVNSFRWSCKKLWKKLFYQNIGIYIFTMIGFFKLIIEFVF